MNKSREFTENKGLNGLYLAFGFLNWREDGLSGQQMRSPLLLVPAAITQESLMDPIELSRIDSEIISNNALEKKLFNDFHISLPEFEEGDAWLEYIKQVENICSEFGWSVEMDMTQLMMISYLKMAMYYDVENNYGEISSHPLIRALSGDADSALSDDGLETEKFDHDSVPPQEMYCVVDADSSQLDAIRLAKQGKSFILQGSPGTGKSQTITNIIAELLKQAERGAELSKTLGGFLTFGSLAYCVKNFDELRAFSEYAVTAPRVPREWFWSSMVEFVTVGRKKELTVTFRDGTEIQA